jgi:hypothetical protein
MSDFVLSVVPTDPWWQPGPDDGRAAADLVASLALADGDSGWCEVNWSDEVKLVDCGENLERITCPHCNRELSSNWFGDETEQRFVTGAGFTSLDVLVPCCGASTTLNDLGYEWPLAFASFEIAIWNGSRLFESGGDGLLDPEAAAAVEHVLGHAVRQVRAHY